MILGRLFYFSEHQFCHLQDRPRTAFGILLLLPLNGNCNAFNFCSRVKTIKNLHGGTSWWRSGLESACRCRGHGFEPWSGKIPHATEQLSPRATTTEPACLESCSATREASAMRSPRTAMKSMPCSAQLEKARAQQRRPNTGKNKQTNK